ncbi:MAG: hypothetical protein Ct9H300mP25_00600 [Acidobacteriota bacterium]|nr:MAG: hypothetical protein Ct9H300mP25_00600 [Acidobacteriota bacterium]
MTGGRGSSLYARPMPDTVQEIPLTNLLFAYYQLGSYSSFFTDGQQADQPHFMFWGAGCVSS